MNRSVARAAPAASLSQVAPAAPPLPPWIRVHLDAATDPDPARRDLLARNVRPLDAESRAIARSAAAVVEAWLEPASPDVIRLWLAPIAASVQGAPGDDAGRAAYVAAVVMLELPRAAFTREAQREALRGWVFWPAAAEIERLLGPVAARWRAQRAALLRLAEDGGVAKAAEPAPVLGADERARIVARFRARYEAEVLAPAAARAARATQEAPVARKAAPVRDEVLLEIYRAGAARGGPGAEAAALRARAIEARLRERVA